MHTQTTPAPTPATIPCPGGIPWCTDHWTHDLDEVCDGRLTGVFGRLAVTYSAENGLTFGTWNLADDLTPQAWAALNQAVNDATTALQHALTAVTR